MHLTISHPEIPSQLMNFRGGIWAPKAGGKRFLVIKTSKEAILTARVNMGFSFYLAPIKISKENTYAIVTAFHDDADEPLTIWTPLVADNSGTKDFFELFRKTEFEVFFFDEHNRELLSYKAIGNLPSMRETLINTPLLGAHLASEMLDKAESWFAQRTAFDDEKSFRIKLVESLFPEDFLIQDLRGEAHTFVGSQGWSTTSLVRDEPGRYQEQDIVFLLQEVFSPHQIYLGPIKEVDSKEFVDVMVVSEKYVYLIQAKDSPNTEKIIKTTAQRKRAKSVAQLTAAANQLRGAIAFTQKNPLLRFVKDGEIEEVNVTDKQLIGISIIKEIFNDMFDKYNPISLDLMESTKVPAVFFDYPEFSKMTLYCQNEGLFLDAIHRIFSHAVETGKYPRLRFSGKPMAQ